MSNSILYRIFKAASLVKMNATSKVDDTTIRLEEPKTNERYSNKSDSCRCKEYEVDSQIKRNDSETETGKNCC